MSLDAAVPPAQGRYRLLANATERHLAWARDFALAGDVDSAVDAIRDAHATSAELGRWAASDCGP